MKQIWEGIIITMRNVTIKRDKRFVASLIKMKVYIEDAMSNEIELNGVHYRKIGVLKNGATINITIGNEQTKVMVISGKISIKNCNDYYNIPAGEDDVYLSGSINSHPSSANSFEFHGVTDRDDLANRKERNKLKENALIGAVGVGIISTIIGIVMSTSSLMPYNSVQDKRFYVSGMSINLTDEFNEKREYGYDGFYEIDSMYVGIIKQPFYTLEGLDALTVEEYGTLLLEEYNIDSDVELINKNDLIYFTLKQEDPTSKAIIQVNTYLYKKLDAFFIVSIGGYEKYMHKNTKKVNKYLESIIFY